MDSDHSDEARETPLAMRRRIPVPGADFRNRSIEWLPKYALELNDIEVVWHDLKAHHLAHQTFANADELDQAIHQARRRP